MLTIGEIDRILFQAHTYRMKKAALPVFVVVLTTGVLGGSALFTNTALAGPNCTCRHSGGDVNEGQTACIKTPKGMAMARCERVLNNTSWKMLDVPCPFANAEQLGPPLSLPADRPLQSTQILTAYDIALEKI
jgi:hypothetical protein